MLPPVNNDANNSIHLEIQFQIMSTNSIKLSRNYILSSCAVVHYKLLHRTLVELNINIKRTLKTFLLKKIVDSDKRLCGGPRC